MEQTDILIPDFIQGNGFSGNGFDGNGNGVNNCSFEMSEEELKELVKDLI
ncbi:hypothetical protein IJ531_00220 [bacterium]|nr:hypothetical protein [bacterium]